MKLQSLLLISIIALSVSCERQTLELTKNNPDTKAVQTPSSNPPSDNAPVSSNLTPSNGYRDIETTVTLSYTDADSDQATSCSISGLSNLTESTACACSSGTCTVGVTGTASYTGAVSFNYTVTANSAISNSSSASFTLNAIGASSTDEWVRIPANAGGMGLSEFYVMKYEAKAWNDGNTNSTIEGGEVDTDGTGVATGSNIPVSIADNQPWRSINANDLAAECESLGANYHLISNPEWMAIARDIENVNANWTGGTVGTGCLFRGNSGEATVGTGTTNGDSCGYNAATDPEQGSGRDLRSKHTLSTGQEIFDISGNVYEWTDWDKDTVGFQIGPTTCTTSAELPSVACGALADADYNTNNGGYTRTEGAGYYFGGSGGAALRGGNWSRSTAGAFALDFYFSPSGASAAIGFRCVFRP